MELNPGIDWIHILLGITNLILAWVIPTIHGHLVDARTHLSIVRKERDVLVHQYRKVKEELNQYTEILGPIED